MSFQLVTVEDESLTCSESGTIWGQVYFANDDLFFPERGWKDMVVAFTNAWLEALIRIATAPPRQQIVRFMDGPFQLSLLPSENATVKADLIHKGILEQSATAVTKDLLENAISVSNSLLIMCEKREWLDWPDTKTLTTNKNLGVKALTQLKK
jgi:hypothetical protein